jgi:hypothetical protein
MERLGAPPPAICMARQRDPAPPAFEALAATRSEDLQCFCRYEWQQQCGGRSMTQFKYYAVLTGDIIKSRRLPPVQLESVRSSLMSAVDTARGWKRGLVKGKPEFFRGDAWQLLLTDPAMAMRVLLRASLLAGGLADSRIAIGLGEVEMIVSRRVSLSTGQAFILAGKALDNMTRYSSMTIAVPKSVGPLSDWLPVVGHLCDSLIGQWTRRQAEIVCAAIDPKEPDYAEIGQSLMPAVSKQAVAKGLGGASWYVIREAVRLFEEKSWETVLRPGGYDSLNRLSVIRQPK